MATKQLSFDLDDEKVVKLEEMDPLYRYQGHFKDTLQILHPDEDILLRRSNSGKGKKSKTSRRRNNPRYKTQPITFDEIKEVDEESSAADDAKTGLINQFSEWSKSVDGLMSKRTLRKGQGSQDNADDQRKNTVSGTEKSQSSSALSSKTGSGDGTASKSQGNREEGT